METRQETYQLHLIPGEAPQYRRRRRRRSVTPGWHLDRVTRQRGLVGVAEARRALRSSQPPEDLSEAS